MPELQSCYFCGTVGESLREYATVPERLGPSAEEQRTVVLCTTCHEKLRRVVEPLVTRLDDAAEAPGSRPDRARRRSNASSGGRATQEVTFDSSATDDATASPGSAETTAGERVDEASGTDADSTATTDAAAEASTDDDTSADDTSADDTSTDDDTSADDTSADDISADGDISADDTSADDTSTDDETSADVPPNYYKVMRLLQNREFPIDRGDLTALVTGAYDVSDRECERILEAAKERGVLVESNGSFHLGS